MRLKKLCIMFNFAEEFAFVVSESGGCYQLLFPEKRGLIREGAYLGWGGGGVNRGFSVLPHVIMYFICCRRETHVKIWSHW